ncbi:MAG: ComEA family DNA-binding protein [Pyrinomonadaceae bacterium]
MRRNLALLALFSAVVLWIGCSNAGGTNSNGNENSATTTKSTTSVTISASNTAGTNLSDTTANMSAPLNGNSAAATTTTTINSNVTADNGNKNNAAMNGNANVNANTATANSNAMNGEPLDLNSATKEQLDALPGVGQAYSQKIISNRPYREKTYLLRKKVVPEATYKQIENTIVARQKGK